LSEEANAYEKKACNRQALQGMRQPECQTIDLQECFGKTPRRDNYSPISLSRLLSKILGIGAHKIVNQNRGTQPILLRNMGGK
jgi:hypothetical protein